MDEAEEEVWDDESEKERDRYECVMKLIKSQHHCRWDRMGVLGLTYKLYRRLQKEPEIEELNILP